MIKDVPLEIKFESMKIVVYVKRCPGKLKSKQLFTLMIVWDLEFQQGRIRQRDQTNGLKTSIKVLNDFSKKILPTIVKHFLWSSETF